MANRSLDGSARIESRQLKWFILIMSGAMMAAMQIVDCVSLSKELYRCVLDWVFPMALVTLLVLFSFRRIDKVQAELTAKEEEASESARSLQHIIDHTEDAVVMIDTKGNYTFANKAIEKITGYPLEKLLTMNLRDTVWPRDYRFIWNKLESSPIDELLHENFYCDLMQRHGNRISVRMHFMPIKGGDGQLSGFQTLIRQIGDYSEIEKSRQEKERYLKAIIELGQIVIRANEELPYDEILRVIGLAAGASKASIILRGDGSPGLPTTEKSAEWFAEDTSLQTAENNRQCLVGDNDNIEEQVKETLRSFVPRGNGGATVQPSSDGAASTLILPLILTEGFAGLVTFSKVNERGGWNPRQVSMLQTVASIISTAMERRRANEQLKLHFLSLAEAVSNSMSFVDPYTASHQERVAKMVRDVGIRLGLDENDCQWLYLGGLLHDVGKTTIPISILAKPGQLRVEEWGLVKSHARRGHEILEKIDLPERVVDMVLHHHERLDGSGYPDGMRGDDIGLEARILAVCDVAEAMTSHRPYRPARSLEEALAELLTNKARKYDPQIVDLFVDMMKEDNMSICNAISTC